MIPWYWLILTAIFSAVAGFMMLALCMASREADDKSQTENQKEDT